jgi:uridine kinase
MSSQEVNHVSPEQGFHHEIERKFTVATLPENLSSIPHYKITQSYLGNGVRVRKINEDQYFLGEKIGEGFDRLEKEIPITEDEYFQNLSQAIGGTIIKERYEILRNGRKIELDIYEGKLAGLVTVEVEFGNIEQCKSFSPPIWFGGEVTGLKDYANEYLAKTQILPSDLNKRRELPAFESDINSEKSLSEGIKSLIKIIEAKKEAKKGRPVFVMIAGRTSSGKTTAVTAEIQRKYGDKVSVLSMDDCSKGNKFIADMAEEGITINWDHPAYMDFELIRKYIRELAENKTIEKPVFDFIKGERVGPVPFHSNDVIVVEGLFALREEIQDLADVKAFVDISLHGSMVRRLLRDVVRANMDPAQILSYYLNVIEPMYQEHVVRTKKNADLILLNEYNLSNEAAKSGLFEVQVKFREPDMEKRERQMGENGAEFLGAFKQEDLYIIPKDKDINKSDELIRLRKQHGKTYFIYKGPCLNKEIRIRPKFEFEIDEKTVGAIFDRYGEKGITVNKQREMYFYNGLIINLDSVTKKSGNNLINLGNFVEIRTNDKDDGEAKLRDTCEKLKISYNKKITSSYFEI